MVQNHAVKDLGNLPVVSRIQSPQNSCMSMWLSEDEGRSGQDGRLQSLVSPLHGGRLGSERDIGLVLLDASQFRIDLSLESEQIHRESLGRAMEAIHASLQRIARTDKLIEQIWTDQL